MSQFRLARISLLLAALGLNAAPALLASSHAQTKPAAAPAAEAAKAETIRAELFKVLDPNAVRELMAAKKYPEVLERIKAAEAFPEKTEYEMYVIDRMRLAVGSATGNDQMAMSALEATIASGRLPANDQVEFIHALGNYYYNAKNYTKAIEWLKRHQKESGNPAKVRPSIIRAHYLNNDFASAKAELEAVVADAEKAGQAPSQEDLRLLASSYIKLKDNVGYVRMLEKLVQAYPTDDFWTDMLNRLQNKPGYNQRLSLDVFRLEYAAVKTMAPEEYLELAELALAAGFPTEAKAAMEAGYAAGVLGTDSNAARHKKVREQASKGAADDQKNIAKGEAAAARSKDGTGMVNLGYAYVTMGEFGKGIDFIKQGIAKGGLKRPEEAQLRLGVAYAKAGRKDEALSTFAAVKGDDGLGDLARYWSIWVKRPEAAAK